MKMSLRLFTLAAVLAVAPVLSAAERWSTDETAVRMGVRSWLALQAHTNPQTAPAEAKALYVSLPVAVPPQEAGRLKTSGQPENVAVKMQGDHAVATFQLQQPPAQVVLQWERRAGLWKIAQETVTPVSGPSEQVALSGSPLK